MSREKPSQEARASDSAEPPAHRTLRKRGWDFVMDSFDEIVFTYALRDTFSKVDIIEWFWDKDPPPVLPVRETFAHGECQLNFYVPDNEAGVESARPRQRWFCYQRSAWSWGDRVTARWPVEFPYLTEGCLLTSWYADDAAAEATVKKVWHLLARVSVNRAKRIYPGELGGDRSTGRYGIRFGHHALEWCARNPNSVIGNRFRPADNWSVPKSKWYQDLRNRVIADYGGDFAEPARRGPLVYITGPVPPSSP